MSAPEVLISSSIACANGRPFVLFGGINVLESKDLALRACEEYQRVTSSLAFPMCSRPRSTRPTVPRSIRIADRGWKKA